MMSFSCRNQMVKLMNQTETDRLLALPVAQSSRLVDFDTAHVITPMIEPPRPTLVVSGEKPFPDMRVELVPLFYVRRPEFWGIEVVGSLTQHPGPVPTLRRAPTPYAVELVLHGITGTQGIEVIGANRTEQIPLATPAESGQFVGAVADGRFRRMFPLWVHDRYPRLTTVPETDSAGPESGEIDLSPYDGEILRVRGNYRDGWIYSATVVERLPESILSILARQAFPDTDEGVHVMPVDTKSTVQ
jgi:hypothetical protein